MVEYKSYVREVKAELGKRRDQALAALAQFGLSEITVRAPVLTGALRDSYGYVIETDAVTWGSPLNYAPWVELGTSRAKAQPHLLPAIEENLGRMERLLQEVYSHGD